MNRRFGISPQIDLQFSLASSSVKPHRFEVSTTNSPSDDDVVVVLVVDVVDSGIDVGLLVGGAVA